MRQGREDEAKESLKSLRGKNYPGLEVEVEDSNGTVYVLLPVRMKDDGLAEPDMTAYDGIYSAFLPSYPADGRYSLSVRVTTDQESLTFPPGEILSRTSPCCGSHRKRFNKFLGPLRVQNQLPLHFLA